MARADAVAIVDYGMGNLGSIASMIRKIGGEARLAGDPAGLEAARKLILPGVGAFDHGMASLRERGLVKTLNRKALEERIPVLGICLGFQMFARRSEEGKADGLGWLAADTRRFRFEGPDAPRIPHMGWNDVTPARPGGLFPGADGPWRFYFVHSYHVVCDRPEDVLASATYGGPFTAAAGRDNLVGVQFHPEKSHAFGMKLLSRFLEL
jgi:glutamine amidotransferase